MKKIYALLSVLSLGYTATAQITITNNDMPSAGDSVRVSYAAGTGNADATLTGPNYLWDFSFLTATAQQRIDFYTPTAIPFNFTASVGVNNPSPDSIPFIGAVPTNFFDYFKNSSGSYKQVGSSFDYAPLGNFSIPVIYASSDYLYRFPLNVGNIDSSDAAYAVNIPSLIYYGQQIHRVNECDGWGTLITPFGTFNTLRVKSIVDAVDTVGIDSTTGFTIPRPREIQYKWLGAGSLIPLLEVDMQEIASTPIVTNVIYQDSIRDSVFQVSIGADPMAGIPLTLYPNPSSGQSTLLYQLPVAADVITEICDLQGRVVMTQRMGKKPAGLQQESVATTSLAAGTYLVILKAGDLRQVTRLVVE